MLFTRAPIFIITFEVGKTKVLELNIAITFLFNSLFHGDIYLMFVIIFHQNRLTPSGLQSSLKWQSYIMSKIKTTSKVSLKLTSRINVGRRGKQAPRFRLWTQSTSPPPPHMAISGQQRPIVLTKTTNNPPPCPKDRKRGHKLQSQTMPNTETTSKVPIKCHLSLPAR